jgi:hypothetical protein
MKYKMKGSWFIELKEDRFFNWFPKIKKAGLYKALL